MIRAMERHPGRRDGTMDRSGVKFLGLAVFGAAMAYVEAAVVVYLRLHFYPEGFHFPLKTLPGDILFVEIFREAATIAMLAAVSVLAGKKLLDMTAYGFFTFGVWDIFYYVWLKAIVGWPESPFTTDLLFLIPAPWIGPVVAPVLVSLTLILFSLRMVRLRETGRLVRPATASWAAFTGGLLVVFVSFVMNGMLLGEKAQDAAFPWAIFSVGEILLVGSVVLLGVKRRAV
ncbi:MAG: hypothetical protein QHI48_11425 [Bacteroidota bacterium]|nr:hypothetical protein [Bacteroidota bacterium]